MISKGSRPCREPGCMKAAEHNPRYCDDHTLVRAVFGGDEPVSAAACPFCGCEPRLRTVDQHDFFLVCPECDAHGPRMGEEGKAAWAFGIRGGAAPLDAAGRGVETWHVEGEAAPGAGPCPFCGKSDLFFERVGRPDAESAHNSVVCRTCEAAGPVVRGGAAEAVGMWNIRREGACGSRG